MREPEDELATLREAELLRHLQQVAPLAPPALRTDEGDLIDFSSNDYLGLSRDATVVDAALRATREYGAGSTASRLVSGSRRIHHDLEGRLAELKKTGAALTFSSGYAAAVGVLTALLERGDTVILDKLCHASLIDGARLSGATLRVFPHHHLEKLERLLRSARQSAAARSRILVVTESVFSMEGDRTPLHEIVELVEKYEALLLVDEAHALGVIGPTGQGLAEELSLQERVHFQMGTLGKAAGAAGGYLAANRRWIDLVLNRARSFIYSTAPPPAQAAAALAGLEVIASERGAELRAALWAHIDQFANNLGINLVSAIAPVLVGTNEAALSMSKAVREAGFLVPAIRYPSVPRGTARLRVTLSAAHQAPQVAALAQLLRGLQKEA